MDLNQLNDMQKEAVLHSEGPVLILAGAGSGKTRVITYRIAYLIEQGVDPERILALTFTNKAAREMRERVDMLLGGYNRVLISTFHSFCVRVLRQSIEVMGYKRSFTIYDDDDSKALVKLCIKELELDGDDGLDVKMVKNKISSLKNDNISVAEYADSVRGNYFEEDIADVYELYEKKLKANQALDFNDLLNKTLKLFKEHKDVLDYYKNKFQYIHVDEYQDTNKTQYELIRLLASGHNNLCVVGDDDQSIYGWRGANIRNILDFEKDFKDTFVIRLEQNYRSTDVILEAANNVISNNVERKPKKLWTEQKDGELIKYYRADNEKDEAYFVAGEIIRRIREEGKNYKDFAVLYRTNSQSRVIEEYMLRGGIPYNVYGGFKFYSRKEIKDAICYLTLCVNPDDDVSLRRVINTPKRGIGETTVEKLAAFADREGISLYDALSRTCEAGLASSASKKIEAFLKMLDELVAFSAFTPLGDFVEKIVKDTGLIKSYEEKITEENLSKKENLLELITVARDFENASEEATLSDFLENVLLVTDLDNSDDSEDKVSLMTLHSAKGLEFPVVFMVGMENGLFPSSMSESENRIEEERRLCYVGMTRAKEALYFTNAYSRNRFGRIESAMPSPFVDEISSELIEKSSRWGGNENRIEMRSESSQGTYNKELVGSMKYAEQMKAYKAKPAKQKESYDFEVGQKVEHKKFGEGTVIKIEGSGGNELITVAFEGQGIKKLSTAFAPLKPV